jgi:hypothetical protein
LLSYASLWAAGGYLELDFEQVERVHAKHRNHSCTQPCGCMVLRAKINCKLVERRGFLTNDDVAKKLGGWAISVVNDAGSVPDKESQKFLVNHATVVRPPSSQFEPRFSLHLTVSIHAKNHPYSLDHKQIPTCTSFRPLRRL